ncbi:DUF6159 family protein [Iamia majanohamensis]|uniref:DUF6159 family protein n=1 Tax=Iamia majanohamensis TaxID=467976 RepID=A0AAF0BX22_9ACTN|nr:DUF6159 family protein [Iamia majanohamensis]WCO68109.1 DUF6159 family protein [Iamia majanohamensis]
MGRIRRSWEILKESAVVLRADKELVAIPLLGLVVTLVVVAAFGGAAWATLTETVDASGTGYEPSAATYAVGVVGYLAVSIVGTYFTAALVAGAHQRLTGEDPSLGTAFGGASRRLPQVVGWALLAGTVGLVLQAIADRGAIGRLVAGMLDFGFQVLTFLAVPVVVVEGLGPGATLKRSTELFRTTWGENLTAQLGFGLIGFLVMLPGVAVAVLVGLVVPLVGIVLGVLWVAAVALVMSALNGIFRAALYQYATTGSVPSGFSPDAITRAFAPRTGAFGGRR